MEKQNTRVELTEERVREIVREELQRSMLPKELTRLLEPIKRAKVEVGTIPATKPCPNCDGTGLAEIPT